MKVLHYINNLGSGGAEKLLSDILPAIQAQNIDVELMLCNSAANVSSFEHRIRAAGIKISDMQISFYNPLQIVTLASYIRNNQFDIVHAHLFPSQYWLAFASILMPRRIKLVKTEHSVYNERKNYMLLRPIEKYVYSRYHRIIAISGEVKINLDHWIANSRAHVINNGVNLAQIQAVHADVNHADYDFLDSSAYNILMVGRFDGSQKDQSTLLYAMSKLPKTFRLYLVGEGINLETAKRLSKTLNIADRVEFLGRREDVYQLMHLVDLNVLSTNHEGLSGVVLEALASRRPFLGSNVVGVQELVPSSDFLFNKGDSTDLANKILQVSRDERLRISMISAALLHVKAYDISKMVERYIDTYHKLQ